MTPTKRRSSLPGYNQHPPDYQYHENYIKVTKESPPLYRNLFPTTTSEQWKFSVNFTSALFVVYRRIVDALCPSELRPPEAYGLNGGKMVTLRDMTPDRLIWFLRLKRKGQKNGHLHNFVGLCESNHDFGDLTDLTVEES